MKTRLLLFILLLGVTGAAFASQQKPAPAPKKAAAQPPAEKPKVTEIREDGLKSLLGASAAQSRPLLVNFWATWCTPCREEFPDLVRVRERFPEAALDFVTVSLDDVSDIETTVPTFLAEMRAGRMPAYLLNAEDEGVAAALVDATWQGELPATFLFDRAGALAFRHTGRIKPAELAAAVEKTLAAN